MKTYLKYIFQFILLIGVLTSCFKEDEKIDIPMPGENETDTIVLGNIYYNQVWVDLNGLQEKANHKIDTWDLAFSCSENNFTIKLNSALTMYAGTNKASVFENVVSEEGIEMHFDASSGNPDSLAFGGWYQIESEEQNTYSSKEYVYVVNRGTDSDLTEIGFKKVQFFIDGEDYVIRYANLDGTEEKTATITKNNAYNYIHLSFEDGIVNIEPPKAEWSLKFSRYSKILYTNEDEPYDYNVVGVLLNPYQVMAVETDMKYEDIVLSDTSLLDFTRKADVIGYSWKYYDFDTGSYTIVQDKNYVVKNRDGFFYKIRFISFYDQSGNKGSIVYQVKRL